MAGSKPDFGGPSKDRRALLGPIMLGVLLLSIATAWIIAQSRGGAAIRGSELLAEMRRKGLPALWGTESVDIWLVAFDPKDRPVAWEHITRQPADRFYGGTLELGNSDGRILHESWRLNANATEGIYQSTSLGQQGWNKITISFKNGQVSILQDGHPPTVASSPAPADYVPEGVARLLMFLTSQRGETVGCRMVFNSNATTAGQVNFSSVSLVPDGPGRARIVSPGSPGERYSFDEQGLVNKIEQLGTKVTYRRVSRDEAATHFPQLKQSKPRLLDRLFGSARSNSPV